MTEKSTLPLAITADQIGIKAVTLRRWCEYHASYLSPGANPPTGQARRFNSRDIEVLKTVRDLREEGFSSARINEKLSGLTFAEIDTSEIAAADSEDTAIAHTAAQEGLQSTQALIMVVQDLQRQVGALQQARQEDKQEEQRPRFDTITAIGIGICIGLLFAAILIGLAWLYDGTP
jgi:DNA-binding transcriptional MerR regulator